MLRAEVALEAVALGKGVAKPAVEEAVKASLGVDVDLAWLGIDLGVDRRYRLLEGQRLGDALRRTDADLHIRVAAEIAVLLEVVSESDDDRAALLVEPVEVKVHEAGGCAFGGVGFGLNEGDEAEPFEFLVDAFVNHFHVSFRRFHQKAETQKTGRKSGPVTERGTGNTGSARANGAGRPLTGLRARSQSQQSDDEKRKRRLKAEQRRS